MVDKPYFMNKSEWYTYDFSSMMYVLTDKAPKSAKESYDSWVRQVNGENK